jgi:hypothetical protein
MRWIAAALVVLGIGSNSEAAAQTVQQLRIRWGAADARAAAAPAADARQPSSPFTVVDRRTIAGPLARQRDPQLSPDQLVVHAVNAAGDVLDSQLIRDPRLLRAEIAGPTGELSGRTLQRANPEFLLDIPDTAGLAQIRVYQPRWTGTAFELDLIGTIAVN